MEDFERAFWITRIVIWGGVGSLPGAILMPFVFYRNTRDPILGAIAGFVLEISGRFPKRGEKIGFEGFNFTVESIDKKRLKQIKVTLPHEA